MSQSQRPVSLDDDHLSLSPVVGRIEPDASVYDALTDLFLGEVEPTELTTEPTADPANDAPTGVTSPAVPTRIEALVLGHLPVLGSAWASQYVRHAASSENRPIAYVRLQSAYASVELISPSKDHPPITDTRTASFQQALRAARSHTDRWIIRTDDADGAEAHFGLCPELVTLLTSADEAAVVGAYRTLKQLSQASTDDARFRLVVLGNDAARTEAVGEKLTEAARSFLNLEIDRVLCDGRIHASQAPTLLFSGSCPDAEAMLAEVLDEPVDRTLHAATPAEPTPEPVAEDPVVEPKAPIVVEPPRVEVAPEPIEPAPAATAPPPIASVPPPSTPEPTETPTTLAELLPNAIALPFTCPFTELVELAMDGSGQAHVMAYVSDEETMHRAVAELTRASAWLRDHTGLIRAALPSASALGETSALMHLFVSDARLGRALLDTPIRMHLLADCTVTTRDQRYHAELN